MAKNQFSMHCCIDKLCLFYQSLLRKKNKSQKKHIMQIETLTYQNHEIESAGKYIEKRNKETD